MATPTATVQDAVHRLSLDDPETFWHQHAQRLHWHTPYTRALRQSGKRGSPQWSWFEDGEISTAYNCVDRHVDNGHGDAVALIWDSAVTGAKERYTYAQVQQEVALLAGILQDQGVKRGDVVLIYMPMIPAAVFAVLATIRLGALHAIVFGGFAPTSLAQRIEHATPSVIMTASCGVEGNKGPLAYQPLVEEALAKSSWKPHRTIIWQRSMVSWEPRLDQGQSSWQGLVEDGRRRRLSAECVPIKSTDGLYIIYTSGTTGAPKGIVRSAGGHAVALSLSMSYLFDIRGAGDVIFTASDIGWVVGHSYIIYAPLLAGATTVLFEGKPVGTPDASTFWRIIEEYQVNVLFTAPTALRAIHRDDPSSRLLSRYGARGGLQSLRGLFLAGERSEPSLVKLYQELLWRYIGRGATVVDHWWSSESGSPITGVALAAESVTAHEGQLTRRPKQQNDVVHARPGSAGKPMPGFDVRVVDEMGNEVARGASGNLVLKMPLAPSALTHLFKDEGDARFHKSYLARFEGRWFDTGDAGLIDEDGFVYVMSRSDDIINVAAHRLSAGAIEGAIMMHPAVAEVAVVGMPDPVKGHVPFAFVVPPEGSSAAVALPALSKEIDQLVRNQIGGIASLGGVIYGRGLIPKTRSGKSLRRCLRQLVEHGVRGDYDHKVDYPATIEDKEVVEEARRSVIEYFEKKRRSLAREAKL
ncbi:hypothetical protein CLAIMM_11497 [Cladophialophora immunda]|nr:hypothetical protein CLAIMM_11497 [Cladophialophora immunda]